MKHQASNLFRKDEIQSLNCKISILILRYRFKLCGADAKTDFFVSFLILLVLFSSLISFKSENECFYRSVSMATGQLLTSKKRILPFA